MSDPRRARAGLWLAALLLAFASLPFSAAAQPGDPTGAAVLALRQATPGVSTVTSPLTGLVSFMSTSGGAGLPIGTAAAAALPGPAEARSAAFLRAHGPAFGIAGAAHARVEHVAGPDALGMERVRYRQLHGGIPVTGGEISVHLRGAGVVAVHAKALVVKDKLNTTPSFDASEAASAAQAFMDKHFPGRAATLSEPSLEVFNQGLLEGRRAPTHLAWFIEAKGEDVWQYIWIDAHTGSRLLNFSQLPHALSRQVYSGNNSALLPGALIRSEGQPDIAGNPDANLAYEFAGDTYTYYLTQHGRDSYDGHGSPVISTVHHCPSLLTCPYENAFWNGSQMVYGEGFASADDVVAHELTHAVTQYSANLFYYMQSGALNESFSDIFGETVDLLNAHGNDADAARWLIGEDLSIGAIRNMMNPNAFGDPGKVTDAQFVCAAPGGDGGGVHSNSGVPNHAYALMVDGGTYNGFTISGIGLVKAGAVQYRALTTYLVSSSGFADAYHALKQSCADLTPSVMTAADCAEVGKALDAVEMSHTLACTPLQPLSVPLCPAGLAPSDVFFDNLENAASGNWASVVLTGVNHWAYPAPADFGSYATSGVNNFWAYNEPVKGDSAMAMTHAVGLPANARLQFNHAFGFENEAVPGDPRYYDGAIVEYSINNGATWADAGALITAGATYGGTISNAWGNPLGGRSAFVGASFGYTASQLDLSSLAGQAVRFRFRMGTDTSFDDYGWFLDDIRIYTCVTPAASLVAAVLPSSRSVQVGATATAFATVINAGSADATGVSIALGQSLPGTFVYQAANTANAPVGPPNTPVTIPAGGSQSFVIAFTPSAPFAPTDVPLAIAGSNAGPVTPIPGLNTLLLSASATPVPDIIALAATATPGLIVDIPGATGLSAFAVATSNVGSSGSITVTASTGSLPVAVTLCQTTGAGACLGAPSPSVTLPIGAGATPTFSFFVQGQGSVPFDPAGNRIAVRFTDTATGTTYGATSVAVRTQ